MNEPSTKIADRDARQQSLVPPERRASCHAMVIGVGAIGRQVAMQLAALGMPRMTLFDDDSVEVANLAPQGYWPDDVQQLKVYATAQLCRRILPSIQITARAERFKRSTLNDLRIEGDAIVFCCVDSIVTRRIVWESMRTTARFFVDGRMSADVLRVIAVDHPVVDDYYVKTLFAAEETYVGACTAQSTIYAASIAAGLMIHQFSKYLRRLAVDCDLTLNLLAGELTAA